MRSHLSSSLHNLKVLYFYNGANIVGLLSAGGGFRGVSRVYRNPFGCGLNCEEIAI